MAVGDLVTAPYMFEFNGLVLGATTDYDIELIQGVNGFSVRTDTEEAFGRHGSVAGRHYAKHKTPTIDGNIRTSDINDFLTKRQALVNAFAPIEDVNSSLPFVLRYPGSALKVYANIRPLEFDIPVDFRFSIAYPHFNIKFEQIDPRLYDLNLTNTSFTMPTDSKVITNNGNARTNWLGTLVGPCELPRITNDDTGQFIELNLVLTGTDVVTFDSSTSLVNINNIPTGSLLTAGFSWWDLDPGNTNISFTASNAASAVFSITHRDAYWMV